MEEYAVMGMAPQSLRKKSNKKETTRSLPITISNSNQNSSNGPTYGRMYNDNSPKMQLPLTNTTSGYGSSLPRTRKNSSRRDSRDSSSSSVTTPSNSSTIFPLSLNSPSSPVKPLKTPDKPTPGLLNNLYKIIRKKNNGDSQQEDYAVMDFQKNNGKSATHSVDYVNCDFSNGRSSHEGDYADMQPGRASTNPDSNAFNLMTLTEASSRGFKPISEASDSTASPPLSSSTSTLPPVSPAGIRAGESTKATETDQTSKRPDNLNNEASNSKSVSRPGSASSDLCSSTSTLVGSRPDSVNSDSIRPASASLHYASLDLQVIDDDGDSRSPRTVRNNSNDSNQEVTFTYAEIDFNKSEGLLKGVRH
ncbi:hypothetical protein WA026_000210 [Henosepilachna vigintioctopunctata]|uniref:Uncharacterized protein n=1 Tax=Henosepilachna vigintioctopunctata TaxID=420089 RepID=A0AAW1UWV0_9CUCU